MKRRINSFYCHLSILKVISPLLLISLPSSLFLLRTPILLFLLSIRWIPDQNIVGFQCI